MLRKHRPAAWGAVAVAGLALAGTVAPVAPAAAAPAPSPITWTSCGDDGKAECATLRLPVDWTHPEGPTFGLAIARRKATDQQSRIGTLVFGPGGPGDSGVQRVTRLQGGIDRFGERIRQRFDIVSFDPRGIGGSNPVTCDAALLNPPPSPQMTSEEDFEKTLDHNERLRNDCRSRTGPIYDHADTLSTVRDVDAIRAALGETQLTFHGSSYGTLLGEMYAETYPKRIRAMVLESVVDHSQRDAKSFLNTNLTAAQDSFDQFVAWCAKNKECALYGQDVRAIWRDLRARAARGELPGTPELALVQTAYKAFYGPDWAKLAQKLADLNKTSPNKTSPNTSGPSATSTSPAPTTATDSFTAQFCSDWGLPVRNYDEYARLMRRAAKVAPDMTYSRPVLALSSCLGWPQPVRNPQHKLRVRGSAPILLANAVHDPASSYAWATNVARQLGRTGTLLTYEGAGHGSYNRGPCMQDTIDRYLISLERPAQGTRCPAA
ncbi:alpha/beta hydrolase [Actinomadura roseirufa]|uniref:alpha/beta hydrolase n=1 Tax=Actinomadura roseirufa TaxID=2094049 RepID=UPI0010412FB1|nr:alpha/beta hydrolase [Actinomadura roseirufa]